MRFTIGSSVPKMLFAAVTGLGLLSAPALAQDAAGKFTLTKEVRWGVLFSRRATINTHSSTALEHCCCCATQMARWARSCWSNRPPPLTTRDQPGWCSSVAATAGS